MRVVWALQITLELEIVGRVGENQVDAASRQFRHFRDTVANDDAMGGA
jgi:hypothetical protein